MRRTVRRTTGLITTLLAPALIASTIAMGGTAQARPPVVDDTSRGSIHEESNRKAIADHRRKAQRERKAQRQADRIRAQVVESALSRVGSAYGRGRSGPDVFDCSGLVVYAFRQVGVTLPHYSRAQYAVTERISLKDARPGDLAFYFERGAHHVSIYVGDGKVVHASDYGIGVVHGVVKGTPWTNAHFTGMGRVKLPK
jgi:cell wall-associated NlpC family hydrolase